MKVSVIVTVYDTEKYLTKCLDSIVHQTLEDIEIIVINDGSPDDSLKILRDYEKKDNRIVLVDIPNGGVSNARNIGIDKAKGEYFICIDSDDFIAPAMLELLYEDAVNSGAELTVCNTARVADGKTELGFFKLPAEKAVYVKKDSCQFICDVMGERATLGGFMGNKFYKTEFVRKSGIRFEERSDIYAEDAYFNFKILKYIDKIGIIDKSLYYYYKRTNSVSNTYKENFEQRIVNFITGLTDYYNGFPNVQQSIKVRTYTLFVELLQNLRIKMPGFKVFKKIMKNELFLRNIHGIDVTPYSKKQQYLYKLYTKRKYFSLYMGLTFSVRDDSFSSELLKRKGVIFFLALLITGLFMGYNFVVTYYRTDMRLSLNYEGIEKGLNPDGSKYNVFEIVTPEVLDNAVQKINLPDVTVDYLKNRLSVYSEGSMHSAEKIQNAIINGKNYTNFANTYVITYSQKDKFAPNHVQKVLRGVADSYTEYFLHKYTDKNAVLNINIDDIDGSEYLFSAEMLEKRISAMIKYLEENREENSAFISQETGKNFDSLIETLQNMNSTEVAKYKAFVINSAVAKDKAELLSLLEYQNTMLDIDYQKRTEENRIAKDMIVRYDTAVTRVVFIPSLDKIKDFYMSRTKTGVDYLAEVASDTAKAAEAILQQIKYNEYLIATYRGAVVTEQVNAANAETAKTMLSDIEINLNKILKIAVATDEDYRVYQSKDYLTFSVPEVKLMNSISIPAAMIYFILSIIFVSFIMIVQLRLQEKYNEIREVMKHKRQLQ